jgi:hypothetical protein
MSIPKERRGHYWQARRSLEVLRAATGGYTRLECALHIPWVQSFPVLYLEERQSKAQQRLHYQGEQSILRTQPLLPHQPHGIVVAITTRTYDEEHQRGSQSPFEITSLCRIWIVPSVYDQRGPVSSPQSTPESLSQK